MVSKLQFPLSSLLKLEMRPVVDGLLGALNYFDCQANRQVEIVDHRSITDRESHQTIRQSFTDDCHLK